MANAANGITDFFAKRLHTDELCIQDICVNRDQLKALLEKNAEGSSSSSDSEPIAPTPALEPTPTLPAGTPTPSPTDVGATPTDSPTPETATTTESGLLY